MIVNHISTDQSSTYKIDNSFEKWILDKDVTISTTSDNGLYQDTDFHDNVIQIKGTITQTATNFQAMMIRGSNTNVTVGDSASITGYVGVAFYETDQDKFVNHGIIAATGPVPTAVSIGNSTNFKMVSDGTLDGCLYVYHSDKVTIQLDKDSRVEGAPGTSGINIINDAGARTTVVNDGVIVAAEGYQAFSGRDGDERLINTGKILGSVSFDAGNDLFDTRNGKQVGSIYMGEGNDTVLIARSSAVIYEDAGEGKDTVKANCSYTLTDDSEIEFLRLLGSKNYNATGNALDNHIFGNKGANTLAGDIGTDDMTGGKGADTFVFKTGDGRDTIMDFKPGVDHIDLQALEGIGGFSDISSHSKDTGADLEIRSADDVLVLHNIDKADLSAGDFIFA